jgi:2'-5' RNA ligase
MAEDSALRTFVAFVLPDDVLDALVEAQERLQGKLLGVRWVPRQNLHVTVKFLGRIWPRQVKTVTDSMARAAAACSPMKLKLGHAGAFPGLSRPSVLVAHLDGAPEDLKRLALMVEAFSTAMERLDIEPEKRAYRPHATFGRVGGGRRRQRPAGMPTGKELGAHLGGLELPPLPVPVDRLILFQSVLKRPAPEYIPLAEAPLGE